MPRLYIGPDGIVDDAATRRPHAPCSTPCRASAIRSSPTNRNRCWSTTEQAVFRELPVRLCGQRRELVRGRRHPVRPSTTSGARTRSRWCGCRPATAAACWRPRHGAAGLQRDQLHQLPRQRCGCAGCSLDAGLADATDQLPACRWRISVLDPEIDGRYRRSQRRVRRRHQHPAPARPQARRQLRGYRRQWQRRCLHQPMPAPAARPPNGTANCLANKALVQEKPVVCQICHYTPALDLAQVGPMAGPPGSAANGRNQIAHETNSRVMHNHHGEFAELFPAIPAPRRTRSPARSATRPNAPQRWRTTATSATPARTPSACAGRCSTAACSAGLPRQHDPDRQRLHRRRLDQQSGWLSYSARVTSTIRPAPNRACPGPTNPAAAPVIPATANNNLAATARRDCQHQGQPGVTDGIRLRQAFITGDAKATPIVPSNKRFAEPAVPALSTASPIRRRAIPKLYRVSTGHGGVMCEGCHGATHAEWPVANPARQRQPDGDQLQGHTGPIIECGACHTTSAMPANTLDGPHNMHLVNDQRFWKEAHKDAGQARKRQAGRRRLRRLPWRRPPRYGAVARRR